MRGRDATFSDAIERVLRDHGGYAPLKVIYRDIAKYRSLTGKTPLKTIQERVQRDPRFVRIGIGIYALRSELPSLPKERQPRTETERKDLEHTRVQGMLIEIGNLEGYETYTPDKGKVFESKKLGTICTLDAVPFFTYPRIVSTAKYIDVLWFNARKFPDRAFEVEYSTNFRNSLVKFAELQDFRTQLFLVGPRGTKEKCERELARAAFSAIADRCAFWTIDQVRSLYLSRLELASVMKEMGTAALI